MLCKVQIPYTLMSLCYTCYLQEVNQWYIHQQSISYPLINFNAKEVKHYILKKIVSNVNE